MPLAVANVVPHCQTIVRKRPNEVVAKPNFAGGKLMAARVPSCRQGGAAGVAKCAGCAGRWVLGGSIARPIQFLIESIFALLRQGVVAKNSRPFMPLRTVDPHDQRARTFFVVSVHLNSAETVYGSENVGRPWLAARTMMSPRLQSAVPSYSSTCRGAQMAGRLTRMVD